MNVRALGTWSSGTRSGAPPRSIRARAAEVARLERRMARAEVARLRRRLTWAGVAVAAFATLAAGAGALLGDRPTVVGALALAVTVAVVPPVARRAGSPFSFLDLDGFKDVNDVLGHACGDRMLVEVAERLRSSVRAGDTVARFGGDEFVVLLTSVAGEDDAARVAAKLLEALRAPYRLDGHAVHATASVGISVYPADGTSPEELVESADAAMYRQKRRSPAVRVEGAA